MRLLKDLIEKYHDVWIRCEDEYLQKLFLLQAECEGFKTLNGQKPTELACRELYGISDDMTIGYLSNMVWCLTKNSANDEHVRIDFGKFVEGKEALINMGEHQVWKQLFDEIGNIRYEGMTLNNMPHGSGTLYYPNGKIYCEGVFGSKGLLCGTEYYSNGSIRFSGLYKYNGGYGPNYPFYGAYYSKDAGYCYEGQIVVSRSELGWPTVSFPKDYGPVIPKEAPDYEFFEDHLEIDDGTNG